MLSWANQRYIILLSPSSSASALSDVPVSQGNARPSSVRTRPSSSSRERHRGRSRSRSRSSERWNDSEEDSSESVSGGHKEKKREKERKDRGHDRDKNKERKKSSGSKTGTSREKKAASGSSDGDILEIRVVRRQHPHHIVSRHNTAQHTRDVTHITPTPWYTLFKSLHIFDTYRASLK